MEASSPNSTIPARSRKFPHPRKTSPRPSVFVSHLLRCNFPLAFLAPHLLLAIFRPDRPPPSNPRQLTLVYTTPLPAHSEATRALTTPRPNARRLKPTWARAAKRHRVRPDPFSRRQSAESQRADRRLGSYARKGAIWKGRGRRDRSHLSFKWKTMRGRRAPCRS